MEPSKVKRGKKVLEIKHRIDQALFLYWNNGYRPAVEKDLEKEPSLTPNFFIVKNDKGEMEEKKIFTRRIVLPPPFYKKIFGGFVINEQTKRLEMFVFFKEKRFRSLSNLTPNKEELSGCYPFLKSLQKYIRAGNARDFIIVGILKSNHQYYFDRFSNMEKCLVVGQPFHSNINMQCCPTIINRLTFHSGVKFAHTDLHMENILKKDHDDYILIDFELLLSFTVGPTGSMTLDFLTDIQQLRNLFIPRYYEKEFVGALLLSFPHVFENVSTVFLITDLLSMGPSFVTTYSQTRLLPLAHHVLVIEALMDLEVKKQELTAPIYDKIKKDAIEVFSTKKEEVAYGFFHHVTIPNLSFVLCERTDLLCCFSAVLKRAAGFFKSKEENATWPTKIFKQEFFSKLLYFSDHRHLIVNSSSIKKELVKDLCNYRCKNKHSLGNFLQYSEVNFKFYEYSAYLSNVRW